MIDAKQVKENLSIEQVISFAKFLGANDFLDKGTHVIFPTICHNPLDKQANLKLYYYENKHLFVCYTECNESFDIYGLVLRVFETNRKELPYGNNFYGAFNYVLDFFNIAPSFVLERKESYVIVRDKFKRKNYDIILNEYNKNVLDVFRFMPTVEWLNEGITPQTMKEYNILYYDYANQIVMPHYDIDSRLVGIRCRNLELDGGKAKYMPIFVENVMYRHQLSLTLYGLNKTKDAIKDIKTAIIFEGEKSCLKFNDLSPLNYSVASCGSSINKFQINLLLKLGVREIIVAFDKEYITTDSEDAKKYFQKLYNLCEKYKDYCKISFIYDMDNLLDFKDSPIDKGLDVFNKLMATRISVRK